MDSPPFLQWSAHSKWVSNLLCNLVKRAYDRNFLRDQLFREIGKNFDVTSCLFSGILLLFAYLDCWENWIKLKAPKQCRFWESFKKLINVKVLWNKRKNSLNQNKLVGIELRFEAQNIFFCCKIVGPLENSY